MFLRYGNKRLNYSDAGFGRLRLKVRDGVARALVDVEGYFLDLKSFYNSVDEDDEYKVGVLLLNFGGLEMLDDV